MTSRAYRCFNPFDLVAHRKTKSLRKISKNLVEKWGYSSDVYVCASCRKQLSVRTPSVDYEDRGQCSSISSQGLQNTPNEPFIPEDKFKHSATQTDITENQDILQQLKDKFNDPSTSTSMKTTILTLTPKSWSENRLADEFGTSRRQARKAKQLVEEFGILSSPNPRGGRKLPVETENLVKSFYLREDISRILPGKKDFISVKLNDGKRTHVQKQLLLCNIDELYQKFKTEHPNVKVGLTKFFTLRPKQCVLAGESATHRYCVHLYIPSKCKTDVGRMGHC